MAYSSQDFTVLKILKVIYMKVTVRNERKLIVEKNMMKFLAITVFNMFIVVIYCCIYLQIYLF